MICAVYVEWMAGKAESDRRALICWEMLIILVQGILESQARSRAIQCPVVRMYTDNQVQLIFDEL